MPDGIYAAAAGMAAQQTRIDFLSNDIANVNTTGYQVAAGRLPATSSTRPSRACPSAPARRSSSLGPTRRPGLDPADRRPALARAPGPRLLPGQARRRLGRAHARRQLRPRRERRHRHLDRRAARPADPGPEGHAALRHLDRRPHGAVTVGGKTIGKIARRRRSVHDAGLAPDRRQPLRRRPPRAAPPTAVQDPDPAGRARVLQRRPGPDDVRHDRRAAQLRAREPRDQDPGRAPRRRQPDRRNEQHPPHRAPSTTAQRRSTRRSIPADVRKAGPKAEQLYETALSFEQVLLQQLTQGSQTTTQCRRHATTARATAPTTARATAPTRPPSMMTQMLPDALRAGPHVRRRHRHRARALRRAEGERGHHRPAPPASAVDDRADRPSRGAGRDRPSGCSRPCSPRPRRSRRRTCRTLLARLGDVQTELGVRKQLELERERLIQRRGRPPRASRPSRSTSRRCSTASPPTRAPAPARSARTCAAVLAQVAQVHGSNRVLIRQELTFVDHLLRVLSGTPAGRLLAGRLDDAPQPVISRGREGLADVARPSSGSRPRCAACSPTSARSTRPATTSRTRARPGYSRQVAELAGDARRSRTSPSGQLGTGVDVVQYQRIRDTFLDLQLRAQTMRQGYVAGAAERPEPGRADARTSRPTTGSRRCSASTGPPGRTSPTPRATSRRARRSRSRPRRSRTASTRSRIAAHDDPGARRASSRRSTISQVNSIGAQIAHAQPVDPGRRDGRPAAERPARPARPAARPALGARQHDRRARAPAAPARSARSTSPSAARASSPPTRPSTLTLPLPSLTSGQLAGMDSVIATITDPTTGYLDEAERARRRARVRDEHAARGRQGPERQRRAAPSSPSRPATRRRRSPSTRDPRRRRT